MVLWWGDFRACQTLDQREFIGRDTKIHACSGPAVRATYQPGGKLFRLPFGLGVIDPLPGLEVETRPHVKDVVSNGVRHIPSEPGARQSRLHADGMAHDDLFDAAVEGKRYYL